MANGFFDDRDDLPKMGRLVEDDEVSRLFSSRRIGRHRGRLTRTAHIDFKPIKCSATRSGTPVGGSSIDYVIGTGPYMERTDVVHVAGDVSRLREALQAVNEVARRRRGDQAERVGLRLVSELPAEVDREMHAEMANELVRDLEAGGYVAVAAVHDGGDGQPHVHAVFTARPAHRDEDGEWVVDRTPGRKALGLTREDLMHARHRIADIINHVCDPEVRFWGGRDAQLEQPGIVGRQPRRRIAARAYWQNEQRELDPAVVNFIREAHEQRRAERRRRGDERREEIARRRAGRTEKWAAEAAEFEERRQRRMADVAKFVVEVGGPGQVWVFYGEPQPLDRTVIVTRSSAVDARVQAFAADHGLGRYEIVRYDRRQSDERQAQRARELEVLEAEQQAQGEEAVERQRRQEAADRWMAAERHAAAVEAARLDAVEVERKARARVQEILALRNPSDPASMAALPANGREGPPSSRALRTLFAMLVERGLQLPDTDALITAGAAGELIRHLQNVKPGGSGQQPSPPSLPRAELPQAQPPEQRRPGHKGR